MSRYWFSIPYSARAQRLRVPCGFLLLAAYLLLASPTLTSLLLGLPFSLAGLALRAWAAGHLRKDATLTTSGPYAHTRNPLYLGTLLAAGGLLVASRSWLLAALYVAVFVLIYWPVIEIEERYLAQLFPKEFPTYTANVPRLGWRFRAAPSAGRFSLALFRRNKEYKAILAVAVAAAFLVARLMWRA